MEQNEPSTGEIVRALRCVAEATECKDCRYKYPVGNVILCDHEQMNGNAADRLESQEREISVLRDVSARQDDRLVSQEAAHIETMRELSGITGELEKFKAFHERYAEQTSKKYIDDICVLTARAERAEKERDAAVADCERLLFASRDMRSCCLCKFVSTDGKCRRKGVGAGCKPKWRGLPQEGEGKR